MRIVPVFKKCPWNNLCQCYHVILLPLQGVITVCVHTQGAALGYMLLPFQGVLLPAICF